MLKITIAADFNGVLHLRSASCDYKIWKTMQHCLEDDPWCQRTEAGDDWRV